MEFVALDFETASSNANSACQLGCVHVVDAKIVDEREWMIRPPRMYFSPRNIAVHGIRPRDVQDASSMGELWPEIEAFLNEKVLVAHNARFDIGVLVASLAHFDLRPTPFQFHCTRNLAKAAWPGRSRYGLKPLAQALGIQFQHHDALEDARTCAQIALLACDEHQVASWKAAEETLRVKAGKFLDGKITSPVSIGNRNRSVGGGRQTTDRWGFPDARSKQIGGVDTQAIVRASNGGLPLAGKEIWLLGSLRGTTPEQSEQLVQRMGGACVQHLTNATNYVVACGMTLDEASRKVCQAVAEIPDPDDSANTLSNQQTASGVRILSERQFRALLPGGKAASW
ncbi:MAG: exonuclease domain-containing protein [Planctomycetota bacterium]